MALDDIGQFGRGIGEGVRNFGKDTLEGFADLGKAGAKLASDPQYLSETYQTAKTIGKQLGQVSINAIEDPKAALDGIRNKASTAWDVYRSERAKAAAEGRLAEFDGQMVGRSFSEVASVVFPASKLSKLSKLGKAGEILSEAGKIEKAGELLNAESKAAKAIKAGSKLPKKPVSITETCPLKAKAQAKSLKTSNKVCPKKSKIKTQGEPISMVNGEELLELEDFSWDGPIPLSWTRFYRSSQSAIDLQLGHGWLTPLDEWLEISDSTARYHDKEGRVIELPLPEVGHYSLNLPEQIKLYREQNRYKLIDEEGPIRIFQGESGHCSLQSLQNESGQSIQLIHDAQGHVKALQTSWGKTLLIQREGAHILAIGPARTGENGLEFAALPFIRYQYDAEGDLIAVQNRLNQGERYAYQNHIITRRTLATGFNFHFEWDGKGRCIHNWGDNGLYDYRFQWNDNGISRAKDSRGGVTEYMHDAHGLLLWQTSPEGHTTHYAYDENNLLSKVTDALNHSTHYEHDEEGRLTSITDPIGHTSKLQYNASGKLTQLTDPLGQNWIYGYDEQDRLIQTQDAQGGISRYTCNDQGLLTQVINPIGQTRTLFWDEKARLTAEIGFDGIKSRYQYDAEDRIITAIVQERRISQYQYDAIGRLIAIKAADGAMVKLSYNAAGLVTHYTDAAERVTEYRYAEGLAQITERIDPAGQTFRYQYDSERNLIGITNAKGERYHLNYDKDENLIEEIGFDQRIQRYRYDAAGHLTAYAQQSDSSLGQWRVSQFHRDPAGRLLKKTAPDGAISEFGYDALGRLHHAENSHARLHFHYNSLNQVTQEIQNDATLTHEYDALGRRTASLTPDGQRIEYAYDAQGRMHQTQLNHHGANATPPGPQAGAWGPDACARRFPHLGPLPEGEGDSEYSLRDFHGNGTILSRHGFDELGLETRRQQGDLVSLYEYDPVGRLKQHQAGLAGNKTALIKRQYGYDLTGKLKTIDNIKQGLNQYRYDPADRLVQVEGVSPERFVHDPANNIIGLNQESGGLIKGDRLMLLGDRHFDYDSAGNLIEERRGKGGQLKARYAYDAENRLIQAETKQGVSTYRYDPLGRRIAKQTPEGETRFFYDGAKLLTEKQAEICRTYVFEPDGFRPLALIERQGAEAENTIYYYHLDHLGTPREMTDASGRIVWSGQYSAYGALALADSTLIDNPIRFQGQYFDAETGLHYNLNRYYDPSTGRFIHQDPIGLEGGDNLYLYVQNPLNWIDPLGLTAKDCRNIAKNAGTSYTGIKDASQHLQKTGASHAQRVKILQSFEAETVKLRSAGSSEYGLRYFDGIDAQAKGRYLFETLPASRESLALSPKWNQMTHLAQWKIRPGTKLIEGRAAAQGIGLPGGQIQKFIPNLEDLLKP